MLKQSGTNRTDELYTNSLQSARPESAVNTAHTACRKGASESPVDAVSRKEPSEGTGYTASQREVADRTREYILDHLERHVTIAELARRMHVSQTQIKVCFHRVYGLPVFTWARRCRMEEAAKLLEETDDSVLEIAGKLGYENGSKFATAFRSVTGESPSEYRRRVYWEKENGRGV